MVAVNLSLNTTNVMCENSLLVWRYQSQHDGEKQNIVSVLPWPIVVELQDEHVKLILYMFFKHCQWKGL